MTHETRLIVTEWAIERSQIEASRRMMAQFLELCAQAETELCHTWELQFSKLSATHDE
jgi:hypothetical protein